MDKFTKISVLLGQGKSLPRKNYDHALSNNWRHCRECHIEPDWLLIYEVMEAEKVILFHRMGSHADLF